MTAAEIEAAFMELIAWKYTELDRQARRQAQLRSAPPVVQDYAGYAGLYRLWGDLRRELATVTDPTERQAMHELMDETMLEIERAKADPALAKVIRAGWLSRYPNGGKP